jgi:hypothetical protein
MAALLGMYMKSASKDEGLVHWLDRAGLLNLNALCGALHAWDKPPHVLVKWQRERELQNDQDANGQAIPWLTLWQGTRQFKLNPFFGSSVSGTPGTELSGPIGTLTTEESLRNFVHTIRRSIVDLQPKHSAIMFWGHADGPNIVLVNAVGFNEFQSVARARITRLLQFAFSETSNQLFAGDAATNSIDVLELFEIDAAFASNTDGSNKQKIDFFCFDACQDATIELAATLAPFGEVMAASQSSTPTAGWDYSAWPTALDASTHSTLDVTAAAILKAYSGLRNDYSVLSAIRLAQIPDLLTAIRAVSDQLITDWTRYHHALHGAVAACPAVPKSSSEKRDMVKLFTAMRDYASNVWGKTDTLAQTCTEVVAKIHNAIIGTTVCNESVKYGYNGISIYLPAKASALSPHSQRAYGPGTIDFGGFKRTTRWQEVVQRYLQEPLP